MLVEVKIFEPDGTTPVETYSETINTKANEEMVVRDLTYEINAMSGFGGCSFSIWAQDSTVAAAIGDVVKIYNDSVLEYMGYIANKTPDISDENPYEDRNHFTVVGVLNKAFQVKYSLIEADGGTVSTNIQDLFDDLFDGGIYTGKGQAHNQPLEAEISVLTYTPANNVLPALSINVTYNFSSASNVFRNVIDLARGTVDLTTGEAYLSYVKADGNLITKQRATSASPLFTFDIDDGDFEVKNSVDLDDYRIDVDPRVFNKFVLNGTEITTIQYATEVTASRAAHGTIVYSINNEKVNIEESAEWLDGFILSWLQPTTTYTLTLKKSKYGLNTAKFSGGSFIPDGYIKQTKGVATVANVPFQRAIFRLDSGGYSEEVACGDIKPSIVAREQVLATTTTNNIITIDVSTFVADTPLEDNNVPSVIEVSSNNKFRLKISYSGDISTISAAYSSVSVTLNKSTDTSEPNYYLTDDMSGPSKGRYKVVVITAINQYGKETKSFHYIKGTDMPSSGVPTTVRDPDTAADETTSQVPEYKTEIEFFAHFKDHFYTVDETDVKFKIYNTGGSVVKTITDVTTPSLAESPANSGDFICTTTIAALALSAGRYYVRTEVTKHEKYIDELGTTYDGSKVSEGGKEHFRIVNNTTPFIAEDSYTRMPTAEKESNEAWNDGVDDVNANHKFFATGFAPDAGAAGWFVTKDDRFSSNWIRVSADQTGTPDSNFIINNDSTIGQYVYLTLNTDSGTDVGKIRYDKTNKTIKVSVDNGATWTDVASGVTDAIQETVSTVTYKLRVDATTGDLIFNDGTDDLFKVSTAGTVTFYSDILPDTTDSYGLGSEDDLWANAYIGNVLYAQEVYGSGDGGATPADWRIEWDGVNSIAIPHNIAIGFMDG